MQGRRIADEFRRAFAKHHPAFANAYLTANANLIGSRGSCRIKGDYCLTVEDYMARRNFPDEIGRNCYYINVRNTREEIDKKINEGFNSDFRCAQAAMCRALRWKRFSAREKMPVRFLPHFEGQKSAFE